MEDLYKEVGSYVYKVIFRKGTSEEYKQIEVKDDSTIYWLTDTQQLYVGNTLFGVGANATEAVAGLMSGDDKKALQELAEAGVKIDEQSANGLTTTEDGLALSPATSSSAGAMTPMDKKTLQSLPTVYQQEKYAVTGLLSGSRVQIFDGEIRVMFSEDAPWVRPSGQVPGREPNKYYFGIYFYAPEGADGFKEASAETIGPDVEKEDFHGSSSGTDIYGRNYDICWFPAAVDEGTEEVHKWKYFGKDSTKGRYMGWYHTIEWYKGNEVIGSETMRINLSNENCHNTNMPYYYADGSSLYWEDM